MKKILGIEVTDEQFDKLFCEQSKGKELKVINGQVVAVEHKITEEELKQHRISEIKTQLNKLSQDFIQMQCGAVFDDAEQRKAEFKTLHNELRLLLGKKAREYENS